MPFLDKNETIDNKCVMFNLGNLYIAHLINNPVDNDHKNSLSIIKYEIKHMIKPIRVINLLVLFFLCGNV